VHLHRLSAVYEALDCKKHDNEILAQNDYTDPESLTMKAAVIIPTLVLSMLKAGD
jgi:hypothetical protein